MGKKSRKKQSSPSINSTGPVTAKKPVPAAPAWEIRDWHALLITLLMAIASYIFSYFYTSFYQGEEGAQYMNALGFWHSPSSILGNWPKTGWKLIYAPAVLFGKQGVLITNCLVSAFTAFFTYKIAARISGKKTLLPMLLLFTQSLWFLLSFKFYSETLTALLLSIALYLYYCNRYFFFSLIISYVLLLRQEFIFILPFFAVIMVKKKKWLSFFTLGLFPILYNCWGWYVTGDLFYSVHESQRTAALYKSSYPRQGFDHYFIMSGTIFNYVVITLVVLYLSQIILRQVKKIDWPLMVPALGFILLHCLFNLQAVEILTSTGGNLRYMLVVSPLMAVLAARAVDNLQYTQKKLLPLLFLIPLFVVVAGTMTYTHNWVVMDTDSSDRDFLPLLFCGATIVMVMLIPSLRRLQIILCVMCIASLLFTIKPEELCCDENFEQKKIAAYITQSRLDQKPIYQSLALFNYFVGKNAWDFPAGNFAINGDSSLSNAPAGAIIIWDTHYATKYGKVEMQYFQNNKTSYKVLKQFTSEDQTFAAVVFEKITGANNQ